MTDRKPIVVVLGGNAFAAPGGKLTMAEQFRFARSALQQLAPLLDSQAPLLISHGNGPQVGHMLTRVEESLGKAYAVGLEVCVAETEGELGYVLEQTLYNLLLDRGEYRPLVSVLTQVLVAPHDPAFADPSKPIGPFYDEARAAELTRQGFAVREDAGRGFRRVVPSPEPQQIVEFAVMEQLVERGVIVVAAGGGGIPVVQDESGRLQGVEAVIDKDRTAALLASQLDADQLVILTCVPCAYTHFGTPQQTPLGRLSASEARQLLTDGHFAPGSMGPKMEAAIRFVEQGGRRTIICDPPNLAAALDSQAGTRIEPDTSLPATGGNT